MNPGTVRDALRKLGVPAEKGRTSAIRQLILQAPALVIAQAVGHHDKSTTRIATEAAAPWKHDAPGDHTHGTATLELRAGRKIAPPGCLHPTVVTW